MACAGASSAACAGKEEGTESGRESGMESGVESGDEVVAGRAKRRPRRPGLSAAATASLERAAEGKGVKEEVWG